MNETNIMDYIPPEQIAVLVTAIVGLVVAIIAFFVWLIRFVPKLIEGKLSQSQAEMQAKLDEAKAQQELDKMELQDQLDQTQSGREMSRLLISENGETRKAFLAQIEAMREDAKTRDALYAKHLAETAESYKGIQNNTAGTLELLKEMSDRLSKHQESDEIMEIKQDRIIAQNEGTHGKLESIAVTLGQIASELKGVAGDRRVIDEILQKVLSLQESLAQIENSFAVATPVTKTDTHEAPPQEIAASQDAFDTKGE